MNKSTRTIAMVLGIVLAVAGMNHGFFETLQGSTPTGGLIIQAISPSMQLWANGGEEAFSVIPNFLLTGIAAIAVSIVIVYWSVRFLHTRHGATVFLLLFVLLFLVGGGIGQIVFFVTVWAFATRINKPLTWWERTLPHHVRSWLSHVWPISLTVAVGLFLVALEIAIFGYFPGVADAEQLMGIVFASLASSLLMITVSFVSGFADDIERRHAPTSFGVPHPAR